MKRLLTCLLLFTIATPLSAGELDSLEIITPVSYIRPSSTSQTVKSKLQVGIGDLINYDVIATVKNKVAPYKSDLSKYYPRPGELDAFIDKVITEGKKNYLGNDLNDAGLIKFYEHLGTQMIGGFADRILETEGIKDQSRRGPWIAKLLAPFNKCISTSKNAMYDANHCMEALTASLVPSVGVGLVYEMTRQHLSSSLPESQRAKFNTDQAIFYKSCIKLTKGKAADVKDCALLAMKSGVQKVTDPKLEAALTKSASTPTMARVIKQSVWPFFGQCIDKVGSDTNLKTELSAQFMECIDSLVQNSGVFLVNDKVQSNPTLKLNFNKNDLAKLAQEKGEEFKVCLSEQKKNNQRVDGMINTAPCENVITNELTYKVVTKTLSDTARETFKTDASLGESMGAEGKRLLDQCWSNNQTAASKESCLRNTILTFSNSIAKIKLDKAVGSDLKNKDELINSSLLDFNSCLEKNLPANISEATNLSAKTSLCSNKLTVSVAQKVAQEAISSKASEQNLGESETSQLIGTYVNQKFMSCLGMAPQDATLEKCSGELKRNAALVLASAKIRSNAAGKMSSEDTEKLVDQLVGNKFSNCMGSSPDDKKLNDCVAALTKNATRAIVISYQNQQIKAQLNADTPPKELKLIEQDFVACTEKDIPASDVSAAMDECIKNFALDFAKTLGNMKVNGLFRTMLGAEGFKEQKSDIDGILERYNNCLNDLKQTNMNDGLIDKVTACTKRLESQATNFVTSTLNTWMSVDEKDAGTIMIKNEFAQFLPCISPLLPASPYTAEIDENAKSVLKPVAMMLAQYIEYSPENAKKTLDEIIKKLSTDLRDVASNPASRRELIDMLYANGALDQFLKSVVKAQVKTSIDETPESELPSSLRSALLSKENFDAIFATEEGKQIKDLVMEKMLKPVLMEQASMSSPPMTAGMDMIKERVIKMLAFSPRFGDQIIKSGVQKQIDQMNGLTKIVAKAIYGRSSLNWEKVRQTPKGKEAEDYIRQNILLPKFKGQKPSAQEEKRISEEAEKLVKAAVKSYE